MSRWSAPPPVVSRPRAETRQATILQLLPLLPVAITMAAIQVTGAWSLSTLGIAVAVTGVVQFLVARSDKQLLDARGFGGLAPASLALISALLYLVVRGRACSGLDRSASDPITWAAITTVGAVLVAALATFLQAAYTGAVVASFG